MTVLNSWQKLDRVLSGKPFGDGSSGNATISSDPATRASLTTVASGETAITIGTAILSNGDVFALYQARGTGVGQWEINKVASGGGSTSIVCSKALQYSYSTTGANVAQVIKIPQYDEVTLSNFTVGAWDGEKNGITFIVGKTSIGGTGTLTFAGGNGAASAGGSGQTVAGGTGGGFRGGIGRNASAGDQGEGSAGAGSATNSANGNGGGGGITTPSDGSGGGGGGNGAAGSVSTGSTQVAAGGEAVGSVDLVTMVLGGGGGGAYKQQTNPTASGGSGAAAIVLISKAIDISSMTLINLNGGNGGVPSGGATGGGGGSGGACLVVCQTAVLGTNKITASAGTGGNSGQYDGGNGSVGRIAIHHLGTVTGTTTPTFEDVEDTSLVESGGDSNNIMFM